MAEGTHIVCPSCDAINRIPPDKPPAKGRCGQCKNPLFEGKPVALDGARFDKHLAKSDLPLLVDFWAAWCGPCKMMAPMFERAAAELEPRVRLAKVDTEKNPDIAGRYSIRGIPTVILFHRGREVDRITGAADGAALQSFVDKNLS